MDSPLLHVLLALPTVAYTGLLALCGLYWSLVIVGVADLDSSDGAAHAADGLLGGAKGTAEAIDGVMGAAKSTAEALDGVVGAAKGAGQALEGGAAGGGGVTSAATGAELDLADVGLVGKVFSAWRVRGVPLTVSLSLLGLGGLLSSVLLLDLLGPVLPPLLAQAGAAVGSLLGGGLVARLAALPLGRFFTVRHGTRRAHLLGQSATLATGRIDAHFGQAELHDGGAGLLLPVRFDQPNTLKKGATVLLVQFDAARQAYVVEPLQTHPTATTTAARPTQERENS